MNIGRMRHVVRFEKRSSQLDGHGEPEEVWLHIATRRAERLKTPGSELFSSEQEAARIPAVFKLRPLVVGNQPVDLGTIPAMRLVCVSEGNKLYEIKSAFDPTGMNAELIVTADAWPETPP